MTDRDSIIKSFSKAAPTYDASAEVQKETARRLAERAGVFIGNAEGMEGAARQMAPSVPSKKGRVFTESRPLILDAGCGTGSLMALLAAQTPGARLIGCDIALPMLLKAQEKLCAPITTAADCASLPFSGGTFDMIASSLAFQWVDIREAFAEAARTLKPKGLLVFSTLGPETLAEFRTSCLEASSGIRFPMEFQSAGEISSRLAEAGLEPLSVEAEPLLKTYGSLTELVRTLKGIGAAPPMKGGSGLSGGVMLRKAGRIYEKRFPAPGGKGVMATYELIFAAARKI